MAKLAAIGFRHGHSWSSVEGLLRLPGVELVALCEDQAPLLKRALEQWPVKTYDDPVDLLDSEEPDLVSLCPTNARKGPLVVECFRRGISVFADKPMFIDMDSIEQAERLRRGAAKPPALMCAMSLRHSPLHATAARLVRDGVLGKIASIYTRRPHKLGTGRSPWELDVRDNGGVLVDLGVHDLDLAMHALQAQPTAVTASQANLRFTELPNFIDSGSMRFSFENGAVATIEPNWLNPDGSDFHGDCCMLFMGTAGFLTLDETRNGLFLTTLKEKQRPVEPDAQSLDLCADFLRQHRGEPHEVEPAEIVGAHRWAIRATQSALQGGKLIQA